MSRTLRSNFRGPEGFVRVGAAALGVEPGGIDFRRSVRDVMPKLSRVTGAPLSPANRLYPGVVISTAIPPSADTSEGEVRLEFVIVPTFHWFPCVGSRRMSVTWKGRGMI